MKVQIKLAGEVIKTYSNIECFSVLPGEIKTYSTHWESLPLSLGHEVYRDGHFITKVGQSKDTAKQLIKMREKI